MTQKMKRTRPPKRARQVRLIALCFALGLALPAIVPALWLMYAAFRGERGAPSIGAFEELFGSQMLGRWVLNSIYVAGMQTVLAVVFCALGGFAIAAYHFRGRRIVIGLLVATALLPGPVSVTGLFELIGNIGGVNRLWAVIWPGAFSVFGLFMYAAAFRSVPTSTLEAARIDGCREWRLWWEIALPQVAPATAALTTLHFLGAWNALLWPATVLVSPERQTLPVALSGLTKQAGFEADVSLIAAGVVISLLAPMGLFLVGMRGFLKVEER